MRIKEKLPAFTIIEVTIAMIIAAISIGIAYSAYTIVKNSYHQYDKKNRKLAEMVLADKLLKKDFSEAKQIVGKENGLHVKLSSGLVTYHFSKQYVLRSQNNVRTDTFHLPVKEVRLIFSNVETEPGRLIDKLKMNVLFDDQLINLNYAKTYSAADLIAHEDEVESLQ